MAKTTSLVVSLSEPDSLEIATVIPTRNRPDDLELTVRSLLAQSVLPKQLIIVDQSDTDESLRRVRKELAQASAFVELQYIQDQNITGLTAARNCALPLVRAAITLFLDDDVVLETTFIEAIQETYRLYPAVTGVSGIITNYCPPSRLVRFWRYVFACGPFHDDRQPVYWKASTLSGKEPIRTTRLGGGLMSFWTDAIKSYRFDDNLKGSCEGEDVEFCARLGSDAILVISPRARLVHNQTPVARSAEYWLTRDIRTAWYLYVRNWNYGFRNRVCLLWLHIGYLMVAALVAIRRLSAIPLRELFQVSRQSRHLLHRPVGSGMQQ